MVGFTNRLSGGEPFFRS